MCCQASQQGLQAADTRQRLARGRRADAHAAQALQQAAAAWTPDAPSTAGVHELLASFFARYTKAFTLWLARTAPVEMRCAEPL